MNKENLLDYLRKYVTDPKIITFNKLTDSEKQDLPNSWLEILASESNKRPVIALSYWQNFKAELEQVIDYLESNLISIDLIHHGFGYSLLYGVKSSNGNRILYYEGRNPKSMSMNPTVLDVWKKLPEKLQNFYALHNGWFYLASGSMGLSPVEDFFFLDEEEWGILDEMSECPVNLEDTLALYTNGMGGYVCIEFQEYKLSSLLWWSSKAPKLNLEFWPIVDSWTTMGFEE